MSNVTIYPRFYGEPMGERYTHRHTVTTAKGLQRVLGRAAVGYGWGYRLEVSNG